MSDITQVTLIGATGELGRYILPILLSTKNNNGDNKFSTQILVRPESKSISAIPQNDRLTVRTVDFKSLSSLKAALRNQDAVISTIGIGGLADQIAIIDAAEEVGVKRFIPSEFANHPDYEGLPEFDGAKMAKVGVMDHLRAKAETNKGFTWTAFAIGNFFDWSIKRFPAFGFTLSTKSARIYDSGSEPFTGVLISAVARAVVNSLHNLDGTANKYLRIRSVQTTQNEILAAFEQVTGSKWTVQHVSTKELYQAGKEKLEKGDRGWLLDVLCVQIFEEGGGRSVVATREDSDNVLVGLEEENVVDVIRGIVESG